jgi:hypothetical protein
MTEHGLSESFTTNSGLGGIPIGRRGRARRLSRKIFGPVCTVVELKEMQIRFRAFNPQLASGYFWQMLLTAIADGVLLVRCYV